MKQILTIKNNSMKKIILSLTLLFLLPSYQSYSQSITGLSGWNIYLDPGHSQNENVGIYGYSEAKKNLQVALNLRQMLLDWTDIDTAYTSRTNDQQSVTLSQRTDQANALGASHFHSIHSDAGGTTANSTLIMWGQIGIGGPEKTPQGGKKMSQIMVGLLTAGMRTTTRGAMGDRDFYQVDNPWPYLHVNRESNMASELSEAGFHTNPTQNQLNMNENWKRLEAKTMFWTILKFHNIARPFVGTAVGIVKDSESGLAINGAIVSLNGQTDTTDTWESLFHLYSTDPNLLRNGFYYFEDVPAGTHQLQITAPRYDPISVDITMVDTFFTFNDVNMISNVPPTITSTIPIADDSLYPGVENLALNFSRPMNKASVEANIGISPAIPFTTTWSNGDKTITINTSNFAFNSVYQITISGNAEDKFNHLFDGNADGTGGDDLTFNIKTKVEDLQAPAVVDIYPSSNALDIEIKPVINFAFNEILNTTTVSGKLRIVRDSTQTIASGILRHYAVNGRSVLNLFVTTLLFPDEWYTIQLLPGVEDKFGNPVASEITSKFKTGNANFVSQTIIDNFDNGIANWWQPTASGSTVGIIPESTNSASVSTVINLNTGSTKSMMLNYGYELSATDWLIREYRPINSPSFNSNDLLQAFVFGDGNNNKFRFALRETSGTSPTNLEVSLWYDIDWIGWKLVTWDLSQGQTGNWLGNGILEPPFVFDSFQMTYIPGNPNTGTYYFDDLRTASFNPTDVEQENNILPDNFTLQQNFPNPFNPSTQIKFSVPEAANVKIIVTDILGREVATLVNDNLNAGNYTVDFNAAALSSGVYFYTVITDNFKQSKKMILMK